MATGEAIPLRGLEGVPGLPGAPQDEAGLTRKFETSHVGGATMMRRTNSLEETLMLGKMEGKRRRRWQRMRWLDSVTDSMNLSKLREIEEDRGAWCAAVHGVTKSWM